MYSYSEEEKTKTKSNQNSAFHPFLSILQQWKFLSSLSSPQWKVTAQLSSCVAPPLRTRIRSMHARIAHTYIHARCTRIYTCILCISVTRGCVSVNQHALHCVYVCVRVHGEVSTIITENIEQSRINCLVCERLSYEILVHFL